ncbi:hypothetical protein [Paenibacillus tundrae]|uniref:Uncharacterized protein n=1 Tax=Paenibacillus tundrae TaxID=528187 RepID=A0ABT9W665_9BACL|nr:hypothetical protein [Paenibacillus tundrae]MDQ0168731.1 hypothetical protein [Paenibacillus tundrae]
MSNATQTYREEPKPLVREVQRKANAGERIKIVNAGYAGEPPVYANGDVLIAGESVYGRAVRVNRNWNSGGVAFVNDKEYVVLEPIAAPAPTTANLPDLFAQFIRDNAPAVRSYLAELEPVDSAEEVVEEPQSVPLTRAKVIEMARERVAELERIGESTSASLTQGIFAYVYYNVEFHVNRDKRTVTALARYGDIRGGKPAAVGIAKCAPDDVFNADIGKAIAAERALGLTLTDAFVNAPKPAEARTGMKVLKLTGYNIGCTLTLTKRRRECDGIGYGDNAFATFEGGWVGSKQYAIIDDTDAVYEDAA